MLGRIVLGAAVACGLGGNAMAAEAAGSELTFGIAYTGEVWRNASGGVERGTRYLDNLDVTAEMAFEAFGAEATVFAYGLYNNKDTFSDLVGDALGVSNIDNERVVRLLEFWYEQKIPWLNASVKLGLYDLNSEFDAIETAGLFIHPSHGIGPEYAQSGLNGPSIFPSTSPAVRLDWMPNEQWTLRLAVLDAVPNDPDDPKRMDLTLGQGALFAGEVNYTTEGGARFGLGAWSYTSEFDLLVPVGSTTRKRGDPGVYAFAEVPFFRAEESETRGLDGFVRVGRADEELYQFEYYFGAGLTYTGLLPQRAEDQLGLAVAHAVNGGSFRDAMTLATVPVERAETNIELTYRAPVNSWLTLQADVQYVINPGTAGNVDNALAVGLRFEIGFEF